MPLRNDIKLRVVPSLANYRRFIFFALIIERFIIKIFECNFLLVIKYTLVKINIIKKYIRVDAHVCVFLKKVIRDLSTLYSSPFDLWHKIFRNFRKKKRKEKKEKRKKKK